VRGGGGEFIFKGKINSGTSFKSVLLSHATFSLLKTGVTLYLMRKNYWKLNEKNKN
jgi:hypothetical protein